MRSQYVGGTVKVYGIFEIEIGDYNLMNHLVIICSTREIADREMAQLQSMEPDIEYEIWEIPVMES